MPEETIATQHTPRLPGLDAAATPLIGLGLGLAGIALGFKPRLAAYPLALTALAALLFRDPKRQTPDLRDALFSPADGTVAAVDEYYEHRYLHTDAIRIAINVAPFDVPVQRSPSAGLVRYLERLPAEPRTVWKLGEIERNERLFIGIDAAWGPLLVVLYAGPLTPQIESRVEEQAIIAAGERLATLRFGARVDLILPAHIVDETPAIGTRLQAGVSPIGRLALI